MSEWQCHFGFPFFFVLLNTLKQDEMFPPPPPCRTFWDFSATMSTRSKSYVPKECSYRSLTLTRNRRYFNASSALTALGPSGGFTGRIHKHSTQWGTKKKSSATVCVNSWVKERQQGSSVCSPRSSWTFCRAISNSGTVFFTWVVSIDRKNLDSGKCTV